MSDIGAVLLVVFLTGISVFLWDRFYTIPFVRRLQQTSLKDYLDTQSFVWQSLFPDGKIRPVGTGDDGNGDIRVSEAIKYISLPEGIKIQRW